MRRPFLAAFAILEASVVLFVVFRVAPARVPAVDAWLGSLAALRALSALGLLRGGRVAERFAAFALALSLLSGMALCTLLAVSASMVAGTYDSVGDGAAIFFVVTALFVVPWLVVFPALQLRALARGDAS